MKLYDIQIATQGSDQQTHWRNIGTVFADNTATLIGREGTPLGFVIDYPPARGVIVPRKEKPKTPENTEESCPV